MEETKRCRTLEKMLKHEKSEKYSSRKGIWHVGSLAVWLLHCCALHMDKDAVEIFQQRDLLKQQGLNWLK